MELSVAFLGTAASVPSARRSTACLLVRAGGDRLLFDCGEGSQRQMQRASGLVQVDDIYLTHFHADHYLGLPGLLQTYDLMDRREPLRIFGPPGLGEFFKSLQRLIGNRRYPIRLVELSEWEVVRHDNYEIHSFPVQHRVRAYGYALVENDRPGRFDPQRARDLGVRFGPDFGLLQHGHAVEGSHGVVQPGQVMGEPRKGRRLVITGDTRPCDATRAAAHGADLLIHDSSFVEADRERALETHHSTAAEAAELAAESGVAMLALVHISARYHVGTVLEEARAFMPDTVAPRDFDLIEIPFAERGSPRLVDQGARNPEPVPGA